MFNLKYHTKGFVRQRGEKSRTKVKVLGYELNVSYNINVLPNAKYQAIKNQNKGTDVSSKIKRDAKK